MRGALLVGGSAAEMASPAGSSERWPWATAHFITAPMRRRTRRAVSRLVVQIGSSTSITSAVVILLTGSNSPIGRMDSAEALTSITFLNARTNG